MSKPHHLPRRRFFLTVVKFWFLGVLEFEDIFDSSITAIFTLCRSKNSTNSDSLLPMSFVLSCIHIP